MEHSFEVELATALLKEILQTLSEKIHDHDVVHFTVLSLLVANEVEEGHEGLAAELVNELALPEKHDVALHLHCFFLYRPNHTNRGKSKAWNDVQNCRFGCQISLHFHFDSEGPMRVILESIYASWCFKASSRS